MQAQREVADDLKRLQMRIILIHGEIWLAMVVAIFCMLSLKVLKSLFLCVAFVLFIKWKMRSFDWLHHSILDRNKRRLTKQKLGHEHKQEGEIIPVLCLSTYHF